MKICSMKIISQPIKRSELSDMLPGYFVDMIKGVVDVRQGVLGLDAELQADIEKTPSAANTTSASSADSTRLWPTATTATTSTRPTRPNSNAVSIFSITSR